MIEYGSVAFLIAFLVAVPLAVWLGAAFTREGRPLAGFVRRRYHLFIVGLVLVHLVCSHLDHGGAWGAARVVDYVTFFLLAMMVMPMLRELQEATDRARR